MRKNLLFLAAILLSFMYGFSQEQTFNTGAMEVYVGEYSKIRLYSPDGTKHLHRATILVGTTPTTVFDHELDAEVVEATTLVPTPALSDFEITGTYDNAYSGAPPAILFKLNAYGWNNSEYTVIKYNIKNNEANAIDALIGLEILPSLHGSYGLDTVTYNSAEGVIRFHRGLGVNMGMKLLSTTLSSLYSFEYYADYQVDADFWTWLNKETLQPVYISTTEEGPLSITSQPSVSIAPGESFDVYYAMALGADKASMLANIAAAKLKYESVLTSVKKVQTSAIGLKNYPNPVKSSTKISYQLPKAGNVNLKIYDAMGRVVASLVDSNQSAGTHIVDFNPKNLTGGVYTYRLRFNDQVLSNKMMIVK